MAVIDDSFIHSGGVPSFLRDDFACDRWLEGHLDKVLRNTDYRTNARLEEIEEGNWLLLAPVVCKLNSSRPKGLIIIK